ncbi:MAG: protein kinase [Acidobacteriota bacterium]|nr:protein kinase [Blastocatellia bacterium]MDW8240271.1 protein kinase [Acidobacteriota bacterium]
MSTPLMARYEVLGTLGKGGMGEVLKARDLQLKRVVAIKKLLPSSLGGEEAKARFLREARLAAQLSHPNIATIYDVFDADGEAFIVMELVEGETLRELTARGPLPLDRVFDIGLQIASALAAAHKQHVVHRDIKSDNIKITPDGHVKILDFGLAKRVETIDPTIEQTVKAESLWVTQEGFAAGSPGYTAPEQWRGEPVDARADIFSFGVVLYEMITGQSPFPGKSVVERITATMHVDPNPVTQYASVPGQLEHVVKKALAKNPTERYQSVVEMQRDLESLRTQQLMAATVGQMPADVSASAALQARYEILGELGQGGMGKVYKAKDRKLGRIVAVKELRQGVLADQTSRARFSREAKLLAQLNHPHVATIHDIIEDGQQLFIILEYIDGERLLDKVKAGPLPPEQAYQFALEGAEALAHAHNHQIIHRDIKTANIMLTRDGHVKVLDFGLAKRLTPEELSQYAQTQSIAIGLTATRVTFGTPKYMSPEQRMTADVDARSDLFSYGVVLCEMLVGELSLMGEVVAELLETDPALWPAPLNRIPKPWQPILKKCLARDVDARYQTAAELIADLKQLRYVADERTEMATIAERAVEWPRERIAAGPPVMPTLVRSGLALVPALFLVHQVGQASSAIAALFYLALLIALPVMIFQLPRWLAGRFMFMRQLVHETSALAFPLLMVNLVLVCLAAMSFFDFMGWQSWGDWRYAVRHEPVSQDIVLVAIDAETKAYFDTVLQKPLKSGADLWKLREYHPIVLRKLAAAQPKVIAFDLYFSHVSEVPQYDDAFAEALREVRTQHQIPIIVGQDFDPQQHEFVPTTTKLQAALADSPDQPFWGHPIVLSDQTGGPGFEQGIVRVVPMQIVRTASLDGHAATLWFPSISLLMMTAGQYDIGIEPAGGILTVAQVHIPLDRGSPYLKNLPPGPYHYQYHNMLVNFPDEPFRTVSYASLINGEIKRDDFFQKYVLIGSEFPDFEPYRSTPLGQWSPYKIHASALNTMLLKQYIRRFDGLGKLLVMLAAAYLILAFAIRWPAPSWRIAALTAGVCVVMFAVALFLFLRERIWFDASYPNLAAVLTGILVYVKR